MSDKTGGKAVGETGGKAAGEAAAAVDLTKRGGGNPGYVSGTVYLAGLSGNVVLWAMKSVEITPTTSTETWTFVDDWSTNPIFKTLKVGEAGGKTIEVKQLNVNDYNALFAPGGALNGKANYQTSLSKL
jgi:hypothetical protein